MWELWERSLKENPYDTRGAGFPIRFVPWSGIAEFEAYSSHNRSPTLDAQRAEENRLRSQDPLKERGFSNQ